MKERLIMFKNILWWLLFIFAIYYLIYMLTDIWKHRHTFEHETSPLLCSCFAFVCLFFDVLGIGAFAPHTTLYRFFHQVDDRIIPGTLNVGNAIPTVLQGLIFIKLIVVDTTTLILMILAAVLGSVIGAKFVSHWDKRKIQLSMGVALLITAFFMLGSATGWLAINGTKTILVGFPLIIGVFINFILGALMTVGVGLYSPCMALVSMLGMSPRAAFPIMMGSCSFLMPACAMTFIKEDAYNRKAALCSTIAGSAGVLLAAFVVKSLPLQVLRWGVVIVVVYTGLSMLHSAHQKQA